MGRAALGTHWEATTPPERERYLAAVASAEAHAYSERFGQYAGQTQTEHQQDRRGKPAP